MLKIPVVVLFIFGSVVFGQSRKWDSSLVKSETQVLVGAERYSLYIDELRGLNVAVVVNPTSLVFEQHLVDFLLENGVRVRKVFAPEHGFRGLADAGELVKDGRDSETNLPIKSLYGKSKKPSNTDLKGIDIVVFDIQDVGVRFYTYISTMHYVMQACAENGVPMIVLDRPNPNGFYVDGPVLELDEQSFVGMHPIPIIHGMTVGELALMINEEGWLGADLKCDLRVVLLTGWTHSDLYQLKKRPSPNLPNMTSVYLYPTLGLFEGTNVSSGRGTDFPFQVFGSPYIKNATFKFIPSSKFGAKKPKYLGVECFGRDLRAFDISRFYQNPKLQIGYVLWAYQNSSNPEEFFLKNRFYSRLAGSSLLQKQIINGFSEAQIRKSWQPALSRFKMLRKKYLLYKE